ncbi:MAG: (Fe-S)-binding protein, partial [Firmicutes bacterium]|nr:(Fe-S)-binding protein [Bacillota bacterium]
MALPIGPTVGILADNLTRRGSVLPVPAGAVTRWAKGLGLPAGGETVLYTGSMYQLIPYIAAMGRTQERLAESWMARFAGLGRAANRIVNVSAFMARPTSAARVEYDRNLANIARLLGDAGIEFGYLYDAELYSGALVHDLGVDEVLQAHARKVYDVLKSRGVRRLITVDPHTTNMLRSVYPKLIPGYDLEVESYLEVLAKTDRGSAAARGLEVVVHDSCV